MGTEPDSTLLVPMSMALLARFINEPRNWELHKATFPGIIGPDEIRGSLEFNEGWTHLEEALGLQPGANQSMVGNALRGVHELGDAESMYTLDVEVRQIAAALRGVPRRGLEEALVAVLAREYSGKRGPGGHDDTPGLMAGFDRLVPFYEEQARRASALRIFCY